MQKSEQPHNTPDSLEVSAVHYHTLKLRYDEYAQLYELSQHEPSIGFDPVLQLELIGRMLDAVKLLVQEEPTSGMME